MTRTPSSATFRHRRRGRVRGGAVHRRANSTITGVLAGRILSKGFQIRSNWSDGAIALVTRDCGRGGIGLLIFTGGKDPDELLVLSQIILSPQPRPSRWAPLVVLACRKVMGQYAARRWAWAAISHRGHRDPGRLPACRHGGLGQNASVCWPFF